MTTDASKLKTYLLKQIQQEEEDIYFLFNEFPKLKEIKKERIMIFEEILDFVETGEKQPLLRERA